VADNRPTRNSSGDLPLWFRLVILGVLLVTFVGHLAVDLALDDYDGNALSLLLGAGLFTAIGADAALRRERS
jgi:hypothetical protein